MHPFCCRSQPNYFSPMKRDKSPLQSIAILLVLLNLYSAGSDLMSRESGEPIAAGVTEITHQIFNSSEHPVCYFAHAEGALISWFPLSSEENRIAPHGTIAVPVSEVAAYRIGDTIVVNYWAGGELAVDSIRQIVIKTD